MQSFYIEVIYYPFLLEKNIKERQSDFHLQLLHSFTVAPSFSLQYGLFVMATIRRGGNTTSMYLWDNGDKDQSPFIK